MSRNARINLLIMGAHSRSRLDSALIGHHRRAPAGEARCECVWYQTRWLCGSSNPDRSAREPCETSKRRPRGSF